MDAPPKPEPPPLDYPADQSLRAIRRGVRVMIALTLLNTILLGAGVFAPGITAFAKTQWASFQATRAARAQAEKDRVANAAMMAAQADAMRFALPADTLVFAEDFAPNTLPLRGRTSTTLPATRRAALPAPVGEASMAMPAVLRPLPKTLPGFGAVIRDSECYLFVHARRSRPESSERLVLLSVNVDLNSGGRERRLLGLSIKPATTDSPFAFDNYRAWDVVPPRDGKPRPLRFYAGQADPADASRWTVDYEWGDARGRIVARLNAGDGVDLLVEGPLAPYVKRLP